MPTYEYRRKDGTTFEVVQSMSEDALTECPTTEQPVKRIISGGGGVVYKGNGFYVTDYKNKNKSNGTDSNKEKKSGESETKSTDNPSNDK